MLFGLSRVFVQQRAECLRAEPRRSGPGAQPAVAKIAPDDRKIFLPWVLRQSSCVARPLTLIAVREPFAHRRDKAINRPADRFVDRLAINPFYPAALVAAHVEGKRCGIA